MESERVVNVKSPESFERPDSFGEGTVWVDRVATRQLVGYNQRGVEIPIGMEQGRVSPGELLKLALIGCAGMSMDHSTARRLGPDFAMRIFAHGLADAAEDRYFRIDEEIQLDIDHLSDEERAALATVIDRVIDAACTVKRTVVPGAEVHHTFIDAAGQGSDAGTEAEGQER